MEIKFSKDIYKKRAINETIKVFNELAKFGTKENKNNFIVKITDIDKDVESVIKDEFCNYVLYLMKK